MIESKPGFEGHQREGVLGDGLNRIKERTCDAQWVLYASVELLNRTPKTNITLCVN